jgi:hypothetical protein
MVTLFQILNFRGNKQFIFLGKLDDEVSVSFPTYHMMESKID